MDERLHLLGIRHHGPGSALGVLRALDALDPARVLIEGPPEATDIAPLAAAPGMVPPVAILTWLPKAPEEARFHPFAEHSPEWQAIRWAVAHGRPVAFIDEPLLRPPVSAEEEAPATSMQAPDDGDEPTAVRARSPDVEDEEADEESVLFDDPLLWLARAAGQDDGEAWWNALVEEHVHAPAVFGAIEAAMTALRESESLDEALGTSAHLERSLRREAWMRLALRKVLKEEDGPIAVVCGAWHVPALRRKVPLKEDRAAVRGLRPAGASCCWVPWTEPRLARASGYGAGVVSPAWYRHLWAAFQEDAPPVQRVAAWQARAARLLRDEGLPAATSSVIEATRLATSLAALRGLSVPGLAEMRDASLAALCHGVASPLAVVERRLVVGEEVGEVDEAAPQPPLLADLTRQQKRLRLKPSSEERDIALDLRSKAGMEKSVLLHRLQILDVPWGTLVDARAGRGTFREVWRLVWEPELSVALAEAILHGPTVARAADAAARARGAASERCEELAAQVRQCLLADLEEAATATISRLQAESVHAPSVFVLAQAVAPLVDVLRYGTARRLPEAALRGLVHHLVVDICAGLRVACHGLDDDASRRACDDLDAMDRAVGLLEETSIHAAWRAALLRVADDSRASSLLQGRCTRLAHDRGLLDPEAAEGFFSRALSLAHPPAASGAWLEGFLSGAGEILLADDTLFRLVDAWLCAQSEEVFIELLPLLRRALASFDASSGQRLLARVARGGTAAVSTVGDDPRAEAAFAEALPLLCRILGVRHDG